MRHRLGGLHCQTYEELFDILDSKSSQNCLSLDIQALLQEQKHNKNPHIHTQSFFFDDRHQIQADEEELMLGIDANISGTTVRSSSIVLICKHLYQVRQQLINQRFIKKVYASIYGEKLAERDEIEVEVMSNIVDVRLKSHNQTADPPKDIFIQEQSVFSSEQGYLQSKVSVPSEGSMNGYLEYLQLVIYYNKVGQKNNKKPECSQKFHNSTSHQHKIWLVKQQIHYSPLFKIYLQKAHRIYRAILTESNNYELNLSEVQIAEVEEIPQIDNYQDNYGREFKKWRDVLRQIENNGLDDKRNRKQ